MVFTAQAGNDTLEQAPKRTHELSCSVTRSTVKFYLKVVKVFILAMFWGEDFCGCSLLSKLCTNSKYLNGRLIWFWYVQVAASLFSVAYFLFYIFSSDSRWNIDFLTLQIITWCMTAAKTYPTFFRVQISSSWFAIHLHYFVEHFLLFFMKFRNQFLKAHGSFNIVVGYCFMQYYLPQQEHFIWSLQCFLLGIHW